MTRQVNKWAINHKCIFTQCLLLFITCCMFQHIYKTIIRYWHKNTSYGQFTKQTCLNICKIEISATFLISNVLYVSAYFLLYFYVCAQWWLYKQAKICAMPWALNYIVSKYSCDGHVIRLHVDWEGQLNYIFNHFIQGLFVADLPGSWSSPSCSCESNTYSHQLFGTCEVCAMQWCQHFSWIRVTWSCNGECYLLCIVERFVFAAGQQECSTSEDKILLSQDGAWTFKGWAWTFKF